MSPVDPLPGRATRVDIVGAGPAGLVAALALARADLPVTLHERSEELRVAGTVFGLFAPAQRALARIGMLDRVRTSSATASTGAVRRPDGRTLIGGRLPNPPLLVSRTDLTSILSDALPAGMLQLGSTGPDPLALPAGTVLIGADGSGSRTRELVFGPAGRPRPIGAAAWRGTADLGAAPPQYGETWGRGALFGLTPRADGRVNWFAARRATPGSTAGLPVLDALRATFGDWHGDVQRVLEALAGDADALAATLHHDLTQSPPMRRYVHGRIALVGDAAHTMGPFLGRGAGEAMTDAATLATLLANAAIDQALRRYDRRRHLPTRVMVRASSLMGRLGLADRASPGRDRLLSGLGRVTAR